jgi:hypothetical protein
MRVALPEQIEHTYRGRVETGPEEPDAPSVLGMGGAKTSHAIDQDIRAAINRNHGLSVFVLKWIL